MAAQRPAILLRRIITVAMPFCHFRLEAPLLKPYLPKQINHLGDRIRARRIELGLLQRDVARRLGTDHASVSNWEKGRNRPEVRYYPRIFAFLGYNPLPSPTTPGEEIGYQRMTLGLSRKRLGRLSGTDELTVARIEAGTNTFKGPVAKVRSILAGSGPRSAPTTQ